MTKLTKITFGIAVNALCAVIGLGLASTAVAGGLNCNQPQNYTCEDTCAGAIGGPVFQCCSTYGTSCCARYCEQYTCIYEKEDGPCNTAPQIQSSTGATLLNSICVDGNACTNGVQSGQ